MVNYNNGKIYKIVCDITNKTYYGSTSNTLSKRMVQHRSSKRCVSNEMTNPKIYLVEDVPCDRKEQLLKRERFYIENNECINKRIPSKTDQEWRKEYYQTNKDKELTYGKKYKNDNKQSLIIKYKEYYQINKDKIKQEKNIKHTCECGCSINKGGLPRHKKTLKHIKYVNSL